MRLVPVVAAGLLFQWVAAAASPAGPGHWIGTWGYVALPPPPGQPVPASASAPAAAPTPFGTFTPPAPPAPYRPGGPPSAIDNPGNVPVDTTFADLNNITVRQVVRLSQGGERLRLRFSNENSAEVLALGAVHVGEAAADGAVVAGSDRAVTFGGQSSVVLPASAPTLSDAIDLPTHALEKLYISIHLPGPVSPRAPRTLYQYVAGRSGDFTASASLPGAHLMRIPCYVILVEVQSAQAAGVIVALGDSITQGSASTANAFRSWPDRLAERLAGRHWAVVNAGIGGNRLLRYGTGPSALARLDRDVLSVPGLRAIIVLEGINDIGVGLGAAGAAEPVTSEALETADRQIISRAHEHGVRVIGATLTPYGGARYFSPAGEIVREALNHWIRTGNAFDAVIDFAPVLADRNDPLTLDRRYNDGDHLHPNDAGYRAMGDAIDLSLIQK
ncbi:MAG TPA: SGNH/GDSL hydrolase family protein [Steroidobacteraceae bacterium]|nr:SGNH/GDSL hydrolase family protein [Steroidobacteraceae bacterium]